MSSILDSTTPIPPSPTDLPTRAGETGRKAIHLVLSLGAAALVWGLPYPHGAAVMAAATAVALCVEVARRSSASFRERFNHRLGAMLRPGEADGLTGATQLALGFTVAAVLVPGWPALAGMLVAGVADPLAALVGRGWGRRRYAGGKSVEGSAAFLIAAALIVWAVPGVGLAAALSCGVLLALAEAPRLPVNDNLYLPGLAAALVWLALGLTAAGGFS